MSTPTSNFYQRILHPSSDNCGFCRETLTDGRPVYAHGVWHPMHQECLRQIMEDVGITLFGNSSKCPICRADVNSDGLFSLRERVVAAAKAVVSGKYNIIERVTAPFKNNQVNVAAAMSGLAGILFGAAAALGADTRQLAAITSIATLPTLATGHALRVIDKIAQGSLGGRAASVIGTIAIAASAFAAFSEHPSADTGAVFAGLMLGTVGTIFNWYLQWRDEAAEARMLAWLAQRAEVKSRLENGIYSAQTYRGHQGAVTSMDTNIGSTLLFSASDDNTIRVWDAKTGNCQRTLVGHTDKITSILPAANEITSASLDGTIRRWDALTGACINVSPPYTDPMTNFAFAPGGVCFGSSNGKVVFFSHAENRFFELSQVAEGIEISSILRVPGSDMLYYLGCSDGSLFTYNIQTRRAARLEDAHTDAVRSFFVDVLDMTLYSASSDGTIKRWDPTIGICTATFAGHTGPVVALIEAGFHFCSGSLDGTIKIWDEVTGACITTLEGSHGAVNTLTYNYTHKKLCAGYADGTIKAYSFEPSYADIFREIAEQFKNEGPSERQEAMKRFEKMPSIDKGHIYSALRTILERDGVFQGSGDHAFHDLQGAGSTPLQKAEAIEKYLNAL